MLLHVYLIDPFQPLELHDLLVRRPSQVQLRDYADPVSQRSGTRWTGHKNDEIWLLFDIKIQKSSKIPGWFELPRFCLGHQFMNRANNKPQVAWGGIYIYIYVYIYMYFHRFKIILWRSNLAMGTHLVRWCSHSFVQPLFFTCLYMISCHDCRIGEGDYWILGIPIPNIPPENNRTLHIYWNFESMAA